MIRAVGISLALMGGPVAAEEFVALAYSRDAMVHSFATGPDLWDTQIAALESCMAQARDCRIAHTRADMCMSLAIDAQSGGWGAYAAADEAEVEEKVLAHCASFGNSNCQVIETRCANGMREAN